MPPDGPEKHPKQALIVLAHPEPTSVNARLAAVAAEALRGGGYDVELSDLYAMGFDPVEGPRHFDTRLIPERFDTQTEQRHAFDTGGLAAVVRDEIAKLRRADLVILQFPIWWFGAPAILKGWLDRVLVYGLYTGSRRYDTGVFKGKSAFLSVTAGGPESSFRHDGRNGDIDLLLWPFNYTLSYMGFTVLPSLAAFGVDAAAVCDGTLFERHAQRLQGKIAQAGSEPPLKFNGWNDWDEHGRLKPGAPWYSHFIRAQPD